MSSSPYSLLLAFLRWTHLSPPLLCSVKDTDVVQVHFPTLLDSMASPKKVLLADIAPVVSPQPSTSKHVPPTRPLVAALPAASSNGTALHRGLPPSNSKLPKLPASGPHGPGGMIHTLLRVMEKTSEVDLVLDGAVVASLYYSPYSSFSPDHDSTGSLQTCEQSRTSYLSRQRLHRWTQREHRYSHIQIQNGGSFTQVEDSQLGLQTGGLSPRRSRKRLKMDVDGDPDEEDSQVTSVELEAESSLQDVMTSKRIQQKLTANWKLIRNLQERQYERLRDIQDTHLDPSLSSPPSLVQPQACSQNCSENPAPDITAEELAEAEQLLVSLSELIQLKPQASPIDTQLSSSCSSQAQMGDHVASTTIIPSRELLRQTQDIIIRSGTLEDPGPDYPGRLPHSYAAGVRESVLTSKPHATLVQMLSKSRSGADLNGFSGRVPAIASHHYASQQVRPGGTPISYRDPALMPPSQPTPNLRPPHQAGSNLTHGSSFQSPAGVYQGSPSPITQAHQHLIQPQRLMASSPFRSRPGISAPSPHLGNKMPTIASPSMSDHPNHRALASKVSMHSPLTPTASRIVR